MSTSREFDEIDIEDGVLVGVDEDGYSVRVNRTDWAETEQNVHGKWEDVIKALLTDQMRAGNTDSLGDNASSLSLAKDKAAESLAAELDEFESDSATEQARLVLEYLADEGIIEKRADSYKVLKNDGSEVHNMSQAAALEAAVDLIKNLEEQTQRRIDELQEMKDELESMGITGTSPQDFLKGFRDLCGGEIPEPKDIRANGSSIEVVPPEDLDPSIKTQYKTKYRTLLELDQKDVIVDDLGPGGYEDIVKTYESKIEALQVRKGILSDAIEENRKAAATGGQTLEEVVNADEFMGQLIGSGEQFQKEIEMNDVSTLHEQVVSKDQSVLDTAINGIDASGEEKETQGVSNATEGSAPDLGTEPNTEPKADDDSPL